MSTSSYRRSMIICFALAIVFGARQGTAQIGIIQHMPDSTGYETLFLGAKNMDADSACELVYANPSESSEGETVTDVYIYDGVSGVCEWSTESDFSYIRIAGYSYQAAGGQLYCYGSSPFVDINNDGIWEITFRATGPSGSHVYVVGLTGVSLTCAEGTIPRESTLEGNHPNPFNPSTTIKYKVASSGHVQLDIINVRGERVDRLVSQEQPPGDYSISWNGTDSRGRKVASGLYFYQLQVDGSVSTGKALLVK